MRRRELSKQRFDRLYERFLPELYRAALFLTGDGAAAEAAAGQAWTQTAASGGADDEREFGIESARRLYRGCERACERSGGKLPARAAGADPMLERLCGLGFEERGLVVLSAVQNFSVCEIARILETPEWMVGMRLRQAVGKLCCGAGRSVMGNRQIV